MQFCFYRCSYTTFEHSSEDEHRVFAKADSLKKFQNEPQGAVLRLVANTFSGAESST